ncbi:MAG: hypothetical protein WC858_05085 [Parcubacteria group bacterium]|jgi:hypothetical protein
MAESNLQRGEIMKDYPEVIGWIGSALFAIAYISVSFELIDAQGCFYQIINMLGAAAIGFQCWKKKATAVVYLEIFWIAVGIFALGRISMR